MVSATPPGSSTSSSPNGDQALARDAKQLRETRLRDPQNVAGRWVHAVKEATETAENRRQRVTKYPDLKARVAALVGPHWNGYVPPELDADGSRNGSFNRAELVAIDNEAQRREDSAQTGSD